MARNGKKLSRKFLTHEIEFKFSTEVVLEILEILRDGLTLNKLIDIRDIIKEGWFCIYKISLRVYYIINIIFMG